MKSKEQLVRCVTTVNTHRVEKVAGDEDHVEKVLQLGVAHQFCEQDRWQVDMFTIIAIITHSFRSSVRILC